MPGQNFLYILKSNMYVTQTKMTLERNWLKFLKRAYKNPNQVQDLDEDLEKDEMGHIPGIHFRTFVTVSFS